MVAKLSKVLLLIERGDVQRFRRKIGGHIGDDNEEVHPK